MTAIVASARPRKSFFLEMFTRDISLEDCILDLIDNSIDAFLRTRKIDIAREVLTPDESAALEPARIVVSYSDKEFSISDKCGGIPLDHAQEDVFNFGSGDNGLPRQLGAYGVGLKRALFKIGNHFRVESHTTTAGFIAELPDVQKWAEKDDSLDDWTIPLVRVAAAKSRKTAGTAITIKKLRPEVRMRLGDGSLESNLRSAIQQTYCLFLDRWVRVTLNGKPVPPLPIPVGKSNEVAPGHDEFEQGGVKVTLIASLAARDPKGEWSAERAGWYVMCNGRVVVAADKTELTGWGVGSPQFHSKYNGFVGVAVFQSQDPLSLPWRTTKRGLNREAPVYQTARNRMSGVSQGLIKFLNGMYKTETPEEPEERAIAGRVVQADLRRVASAPIAGFKVMPSRPAPKRTTTRIQYDAELSDIERVRKRIRQPSLPANRIGRYTFEYFLSKECPK